jgi:purine-binding chemotaxis protein CheW
MANEQTSSPSIEEFAASIAASLAAANVAPAPPVESAHSLPQLSLRERVRSRTGSADLLVFRIRRELFGVELVTVEEALDMPVVHRLPEMPTAMLGVFTLRGTLVHVFAPEATLGVGYDDPTTVIVFCGASDRRVALAIDDVDDVVTVDLRTARDAPGAAADGTLLGVVRRGADLIAILEAEAVVNANRMLAAAVGAAKEKE